VRPPQFRFSTVNSGGFRLGTTTFPAWPARHSPGKALVGVIALLARGPSRRRSKGTSVSASRRQESVEPIHDGGGVTLIVLLR
jgi:hypothetical protein